MLYEVILPLKSVDETLMSDRSNESYWTVLSCGTVYYAVQGSSLNYVNEILVCDHSNESYLSKQSQCVAIQMKHSS